MAKSIVKEAGQIMPGMLFTFGNIFNPTTGKSGAMNIGEFTHSLVKYGKGLGDLRRSTFYFIADGANAGAGRLTAGMATSARDWIRASIRGEGRETKYASSAPTLKPLMDKEYRDWKSSTPSFRGRPLMMLTGSTANSLGVLNKGRQGMTVGIRGNYWVQPPNVGSDPLTHSKKKVQVKEYAIRHEMGTSAPHRPIIMGSMLGWIASVSDEWADLFQKYMYQSFWATANKKGKDAIETKLKQVDPTKGKGYTPTGSKAAITDLVQNADYVEGIASVLLTAQNFFEEAASRFAKKPPTAEQKQLMYSLSKQQFGAHFSDSEIKRIVAATLSGQVPEGTAKAYKGN